MKHFLSKLIPGLAIGAQRNFSKDFNKILDILENLDGVGGVSVEKNGREWRITLKPEAGGGSGGAAARPQLFDGRFNASGNLEIYCGASAKTYLLLDTVSDTKYETPYIGWHDMGVSAGTVYLTCSYGVIGITTTAPGSNVWSATIGTAADGVWSKAIYGPMMQPVTAGSADERFLLYDADFKTWGPVSKDTMRTALDITAESAVEVANTDSTNPPVDEGVTLTVVTKVERDANNNHKLNTETKAFVIPEASSHPSTTTLNVITGLRWDDSAHSIQVKTRQIEVHSTGTGNESEWTSVVEFYPYNA